MKTLPTHDVRPDRLSLLQNAPIHVKHVSEVAVLDASTHPQSRLMPSCRQSSSPMAVEYSAWEERQLASDDPVCSPE